MAFPILLAFVIIPLFLILFVRSHQRCKKIKSLGCKPPPKYPRPWWDILGIQQLRSIIESTEKKTFPQYFLAQAEWLSWVERRNIMTYSIPILGTEIVVTSDPRNIQAFLATNFKSFSLGEVRRKSFEPLLGKGIFTSEGQEWAHSRAMIRPSFIRDRVSSLIQSEKHMQNLFLTIDAVPKHDSWTSTVDLQVLFLRLTLDSSTEFLFGSSVNSQLEALAIEKNSAPGSPRHDDAFTKAFDTAQNSLAIRRRLGPMCWIHNPKSFQKACKDCHQFVDTYVSTALQQNSTSKQNDKSESQAMSLLQELVLQTRDPIELRYHLLHLLLAGRDTTAGHLGYVFLMLATHPEKFQKLRTTILHHFGSDTDGSNGSITFEKIKSCTYLQHTLQETLRLFPAVPLNARVATVDTTLPFGGGPLGEDPIFIPKGSDVTYSTFSMQRSRKLWGVDSDIFRPERWEGRKSGWEFLPFNGGPRICIGQQYALTSSAYAIVRILQRFEGIEFVGEKPVSTRSVRHNSTLTCNAEEGVRVRLRYAE